MLPVCTCKLLIITFLTAFFFVLIKGNFKGAVLTRARFLCVVAERNSNDTPGKYGKQYINYNSLNNSGKDVLCTQVFIILYIKE